MPLNKIVSRLRVSIILSELRPGGMERLVVHLAIGLAKRGVNVLVICLQGHGILAPLLIQENIRIITLESHSGKDIYALLRLRTELKKFRATVINLHDYSSLPYVVLANFLAGRRPVTFTAHGLLYEGFDLLQKRLRFFARFLTAICAVSNKVATRHREYLGWKKSVQVIANGVPEVIVDNEKRQKVRAELGCPDDTHLFLAVGNPRPEKGFDDLLDAVAILREQTEDFMVVIAGSLTDSSYCQNLLLKLEQKGLGVHCRFLGFRQDTAALYSAADIFVLSSRSEGLPMVILEAMMAKLPVIATRVGGIPDAVADNALLVDSQSPVQLADAMQRMMVDSALRTQLAKMGQEHVEKNFGVERMVDQYLDWYEKIGSKI